MVRGRAIVEECGVFGIEPNGLGGIGDDQVVVALGEIRETADFESLRQFRIEPDRLGAIGNGAVVLALKVICRRAIIKRPSLATGLEYDGATIDNKIERGLIGPCAPGDLLLHGLAPFWRRLSWRRWGGRGLWAGQETFNLDGERPRHFANVSRR